MKYSLLNKLFGLAGTALLLSAGQPVGPEDVSLKMMTIPGQYGDRLTVYGYLMRPPHQDKPWPGVILLHGGFWADSGEWIAPSGGLALKLVQAGYVVMALDYRGSSGHNPDFSKLDDIGINTVNDVLSSLKFLQSRPQVDPNRIAIIGTSRGATLALRAAEATDQFKLVIGYSTVVDYRFFYCHQGCANSPAGRRWCENLAKQEKIKLDPLKAPTKFCKNMTNAAGCKPWESDCKVFTEGSPFLHLGQLHTPVLLHHSEADTAASFQAALGLNRELESHQVPHKLFVYLSRDYGTVGHSFLYPNSPSYNQAAADAAWNRTLQALNYYLKGSGSQPW